MKANEISEDKLGELINFHSQITELPQHRSHALFSLSDGTDSIEFFSRAINSVGKGKGSRDQG